MSSNGENFICLLFILMVGLQFSPNNCIFSSFLALGLFHSQHKMIGFQFNYTTVTRNAHNSKYCCMILVKSYSTSTVQLTVKDMSVIDSSYCQGAHWSVWPSYYASFFLRMAASWVSLFLPLLPVHGVPLGPIPFLQQFMTQAQVINVFHSQGPVLDSGRGTRSKSGQHESFQELLWELMGKRHVFQWDC